jgi:LacI family transcriptional regulator
VSKKPSFPVIYTARLKRLTDRATEERRLADWLAALSQTRRASGGAKDTCAHYVVEICCRTVSPIPQEIPAVLGIDNDELLCNSTQPYTFKYSSADTEACGFMAAQMLDRLMRKKKTRKREIMRYGVKEIITRDSTQPPRSAERPFVRRARDFSRIKAGTKHFAYPISSDILGVSRRFVEVRFRAECGRSLHDEIQNARLERVVKLLKETDLKLNDISGRCGYQTDVNLRYFFKQRFGCSMRDYRKRHRQHGG